jgi:hypothetical protein
VNPWFRIGMTLGSAGVAASGAAWLWKSYKRWRRKDPAEIERQRRLDVNKRGRISGGRILELLEPPASEPASRMLVYQYEVAGVTYEAAQDVGSLPEIAILAQYLPGQTASVKYDPKRPTNSILVCEEWCGVPDLDANGSPKAQPGRPSPEALGKT